MVQIVRRHPFHPFEELQAEVDRLFGGLVAGRGHGNGTRRAEARIDLELVETDEAFIVRAEVPGFDPEKLEVSATGDRLVLSGEKLDPQANTEGRRYCERSFGAVRRELVLPADIDPSQVSAQQAHGVLTVTLPKAGTDRPRRIEVKAS